MGDKKLKQKKELKSNDFLIAISAVFLGLVAGSILILLIGENPFAAFKYLYKGALMNVRRSGTMLAISTTLMLVGLSIAFAFKTGLFNIGASGQILAGGTAATAFAFSSNLPHVPTMLLMILIGFIAGAIWGLIPGLLKAYFNVHEVVATIMMNWIAYWSVYYYVPAFLKGPSLETESAMLPYEKTLRINWLTDLFDGSNYINLGLFVAIIAVIVIKFIMDKTTLGYELKACGYNRFGAEYAGIKVNRSVVLSMMIAGGLAGLAGVSYYCGYSGKIQIGILPNQGFDGIAVALLGASNPIGVVFSSIFFGILQAGKGFMSGNTLVPPELADTIIAVIIYFTATSVMFKKFWDKRFKSINEKRNIKKADSNAVMEDK
ncbi:MAG: ABC transporter permease [Pleomorphochaeta sp.]